MTVEFPEQLRVFTVSKTVLREVWNTQEYTCSYVSRALLVGCHSNMKSHQDPSSFSSLQQLLEELENLISLESSRNGNPWITVTKLSELFWEKYRVSLEEVAKLQGYSDSLRSLFTSSRRFSIYGTQMPQEFYVALLQVVVPVYNQAQTSSIKYRIKRHWKVDGNLLRMLRNEGAEEIPSRQAQRISEYYTELQSNVVERKDKENEGDKLYQPILVPEIKSIDDFEFALMEIIKSLTADRPKQFVTIAILSKKFCDYYRQPIRSVRRSVCPDIKLIDLLQTIPNLHLQKVDNDWQIKLKYI